MYAGVAVVLLTTLIVGSVHGGPIYKDQNVGKGNRFIVPEILENYCEREWSIGEFIAYIVGVSPPNVTCEEDLNIEEAYAYYYTAGYCGACGYEDSEFWEFWRLYVIETLECSGIFPCDTTRPPQTHPNGTVVGFGGPGQDRSDRPLSKDLITEGLSNKGTKEALRDMLGRILEDLEQDPINLEGKLQKHQKVDANQARIDAVNRVGNNLDDADHYAKDAITERLEEIQDSSYWRTLQNGRKGTKENASDMLGQILKDLEQAAPNRQGKLQNVVSGVDAYRARIDADKQARNDLISADHYAKDSISERLEELQDLWRSLQSGRKH